MNKNPMSREQIILYLRGKVSQILSVPISEIDRTENFWDLFPRGSRYEPPKEVIEFTKYISETFKVYLTELQWEAPTLVKLADEILDRQSDPQGMLSQIRKDMAEFRRGLRISLIAFPIMFGLCGVVIFVAEPSPPGKLRAIIVTLGCIGFAELVVLLLARREKRKFNEEIQPVVKHYNFYL